MKNSNSPDFPVPTSLYRLQLSKDFTLRQATQILSYLKELGIDGIYCSPYFKAYGSHGYDVTDPNHLNPLIGSDSDYVLFCQELSRLEMMHIIDIVPNHMGIKGGQNQWWQDVLENGPYSLFANFFDINWNPEKRELQNKVLLPILGKPYPEVLENQEIKFIFEEGEFFLYYGDFVLPVCPESYPLILESEIDLLKQNYRDVDPEWITYQKVLEIYQTFPKDGDERKVKKEEGKKILAFLFKESRKINRHLKREVEFYNGRKGDPSTFDAMEHLLDAQFYRLSFWKVASHEINYRRFFNIHELVSLRIEEDIVLEAHHQWVFELLQKGIVQGLRIDHPDGLYDPVRYFEKLRQKFQVYTFVEKILDRKEKLPERWQVEGTVGYEYLNLLSGLFIKQANEKAFTEIYEEFTGLHQDFEEIVYQAKKLFTDQEMASEVGVLGLNLDRLSEPSRYYKDFTRRDLTDALAEVIACFPVYRTYIGSLENPNKKDGNYIKIAIEKAKKRAVNLDPSIFDFLEKLLLIQVSTKVDETEKFRSFVLRFQQLTAPIMAKGFEDTAFYRYNRFISLNEVGGDPTHFGISSGDFHSRLQEKKEKWPYGVIPTSTHDAKRNEDVRMRLNVLSEMPEKWNLEVKKWAMINSKYKKDGLSTNTEYFIYQTLLGIWPQNNKFMDYTSFCERVWAIVLKSIREAKQETSWAHPNPLFEETVHNFLFSILLDEGKNHFFEHFMPFQKLVDRYGAWNSLSHILLKIASPGVVDIYQGNEMLIYQMVDPDNRKSVDFKERIACLKSVDEIEPATLFSQHELSRLKFFLHAKGLVFRRDHKDLFLEGEYIPLAARGEKKENVVAFLRLYNRQFCLVLAGRFFTDLADATWDLPISKHAWKDTELLIPNMEIFETSRDLFTGKKIKTKRENDMLVVQLSEIFEHLPISCIVAS